MGRGLVDRGTNPAPGWVFRKGAISPFVGRDEELRRLTEALSLAAEEQGGIVFLIGQRGIGKTRLAREALAVAKGRGFTVLEGRAYPLENGLAYAPILDAFGPLLRSLDPDRLASLTRGLPELGRLFGGLRLHTPSFSEGLGDPSFEKTRLFESVSRCIERLMQEAPVVLFIDDLHLADTATLELLHYLARGLFGQRAVLLATYANDSLDSSHGLRTLVGSLRRDWLAQEIVLDRLGPDVVEKLIRGILGGEVPGEMLALLNARSSGTPLYIEALINALVDSGNLVRSPSEGDGWVFNAEGATDLPPTVRQLILDRLERLEPADRLVLDQIAILGNATSYTILRAAGGLEEKTLVEALRRLLATGLVGEGTDGSDVAYSIIHPLIQEVAYAEQPEIVRRSVHLAAVESLESSSERRPGDESRLARHYTAAGHEVNRDRALSALIAAGDRALAIYANEEAARHFAAALAMIREGGGGEFGSSTLNFQPSNLLEVLERLGEAYERIGKFRQAIEVWNEALGERERAGELAAAARLRGQLALAEWNRGQLNVAKAHLRAGLAEATGLEPCQELADLLYARIRILSRLGNVAGVADTAGELLRISERLGSPRAEAEANLTASISCLLNGDVRNSRERALHGLMLAERSQEPGICCRAGRWLAILGIYLGDHQFMRYHAERGLAAAQRLNTPNLEIPLRLRLAHANFLAGAWAEAFEQGLEGLALARRVGHPRDLACSLAERAAMLALRGDLPEAESCIAEARMVFGVEAPADRTVFGLIDIAETALTLERGQVEEALSIARGFNHPSAWAMALDDVLPPGLPMARNNLVRPSLPMALMLLAEAQAAAGEGERALETASRIRGLVASDAPYLTALASRAEGLARQALGQPEVAHECLTRAHQIFAALRMPFESARTLLDKATSVLQGGTERQKAAARDAQHCLDTFERLGARRYAERARRLLRELGVSSTPTRRRRLGGVFLSERELEIARLVAEGLTTAEIAERLVLSQGTVTTHLHHIYARLGIGSRTALARHVIEAGLL